MMDEYYVPDVEEDFPCPYNDCRAQLKARKLPLHLIKCKFRYSSGIEYETCPYSAAHIHPKSLMKQHVLECPERGATERLIDYQISERTGINANKNKGCTGVPAYDGTYNIASTEDWDDDIEETMKVQNVNDTMVTNLDSEVEGEKFDCGRSEDLDSGVDTLDLSEKEFSEHDVDQDDSRKKKRSTARNNMDPIRKPVRKSKAPSVFQYSLMMAERGRETAGIVNTEIHPKKSGTLNPNNTKHQQSSSNSVASSPNTVSLPPLNSSRAGQFDDVEPVEMSNLESKGSDIKTFGSITQNSKDTRLSDSKLANEQYNKVSTMTSVCQTGHENANNSENIRMILQNSGAGRGRGALFRQLSKQDSNSDVSQAVDKLIKALITSNLKKADITPQPGIGRAALAKHLEYASSNLGNSNMKRQPCFGRGALAKYLEERRSNPVINSSNPVIRHNSFAAGSVYQSPEIGNETTSSIGDRESTSSLSQSPRQQIPSRFDKNTTKPSNDTDIMPSMQDLSCSDSITQLNQISRTSKDRKTNSQCHSLTGFVNPETSGVRKKNNFVETNLPFLGAGVGRAARLRNGNRDPSVTNLFDTKVADSYDEPGTDKQYLYNDDCFEDAQK